MQQGSAKELLLRMNDAGPSWGSGSPACPQHLSWAKTHTEVQIHLHTHTHTQRAHWLIIYFPADMCFCSCYSFASSRLTVLYSFHVLWKSTLPSSLRWMTVHPPPALSMLQYTYATDIKMNKRGDGATRMMVISPCNSLRTRVVRFDDSV